MWKISNWMDRKQFSKDYYIGIMYLYIFETKMHVNLISTTY